ncbi:YlbF family regulator [Laceyella putida]|uniref:UPF0342 protein ACFQNG_17235 n=1 Tax=Laceyella putida TaxID=110101 RepID=A0ABW2RP39_9BACL
MVNPYDHAHQLARSIRASEYYQALLEAKRQVEENPTVHDMLTDLHKKQAEMERLALEGKEPTPEQKEALEKLGTVIQGVPVLMRYLEAEQRFHVFLSDLQRIIMEPVQQLWNEKKQD